MRPPAFVSPKKLGSALDNGNLTPFAAILAETGDDPTREGLLETPRRIQQAFAEWFSGYGRDPADVFKTFEDGAEGVDELILVANIELHSHCEHHLAPFWGVCHVGYIADGKILGLSKFARLVDIYARRLQVQERMTRQICNAIVENLQPRGVGVVLECRHLCIESRGARARGSVTTTSALHGAIKHDPAARAEFLSLVQSASKAREGI